MDLYTFKLSLMIMNSPADGIAKVYVYVIAAVAALNNCNLGYDIGIVSSVGPILQKQDSFTVSDIQLELFIGALDVSSLIGAFSSNYLADRFGRKACMALSEVLFIGSVIGMACAMNYATLVLFRCFCGIAVGLGLTIGPLYIGEVAPSAIRGRLISWSELTTNIGLLTAFIVGYIFSGMGTHVSWRVMLGMGSILPVILLVCLYFMPESPRWLILQGREAEAVTVLQRVYVSDVNVEQMVQDIKDTIHAEAVDYHEGGWHAIFHPTKPVFNALRAALGIAAIQQLSGIEAITSYFVFIFARADMNTSDTYLYLILFGLCKLVTVYIASQFFDNPNYGRRALLLASGVGVVLAMLLFCLIFSFSITAASQGAAVFTMFWYITAYSAGYGPGTWVVMLEVLPMQIRAKGLSLAMLVNRLIATALSGSFLTLVRYCTYQGYFLLFTAVAVGCVVYVYCFIPETQGRSLEQMSALFQGNIGTLEVVNPVHGETIDGDDDGAVSTAAEALSVPTALQQQGGGKEDDGRVRRYSQSGAMMGAPEVEVEVEEEVVFAPLHRNGSYESLPC